MLQKKGIVESQHEKCIDEVNRKKKLKKKTKDKKKKMENDWKR